MKLKFSIITFSAMIYANAAAVDTNLSGGKKKNNKPPAHHLRSATGMKGNDNYYDEHQHHQQHRHLQQHQQNNLVDVEQEQHEHQRHDDDNNNNNNSINRHSRKLESVSTMDTAYNMVGAFGGLIPFVGPMVQFAVYQYYSSMSGDDYWNEIKSYVQDMIDKSLIDYDLEEFNSELNTLKSFFESYNNANTDSGRATALDSIIDECIEIMNDFELDWDLYDLGNSNNYDLLEKNYYMIPYALTFIPLHLGALRDRYLYGTYMYEDGVDCLSKYYDDLEKSG